MSCKQNNAFFCRNMLSILAIAIFLAVPFVSGDAWADGDAIIDTFKAWHEKQQSFHARFEQTLTHRESGQVEKRQGELDFAKPLLIRWITKKPAETLVVTKKEIWNHIVDEEIVYRYPLTLVQDSHSVIQVVTGQAALTKDFEIRREKSGSGLAKLRLYPKEPTTQMVEAELEVRENGQIVTATVIDFYGNSNQLRFVEYETDKKFSSSHFSFTPPKGVEVEDRTDRKVQERELFK